MIRVSVFYPTTKGAKFDHEYYNGKHAEIVKDRLGPHGLVDFYVDKGLGSMEPGSAAPFTAIGNCVFNTMEEFQAGFGKHGEELMADVPNFTTIEPKVQISEQL